jgi:hypothetical protein
MLDLNALGNWLEEMLDDATDGFFANLGLEAIGELRTSRKVIEDIRVTFNQEVPFEDRVAAHQRVKAALAELKDKGG